MVTQSFPFTQSDMDAWAKRKGRRGFHGDIELFNRLCVMLQATDSESFDEALERVMISL